MYFGKGIATTKNKPSVKNTCAALYMMLCELMKSDSSALTDWKIVS